MATQLTDGFVTIAYAMLGAIGLVYLLLVLLVIFFALPLAVFGAFVSLTVIAAGIWIAYSVGDGIYDVAVVAVPASPMMAILPILPILSISTNAIDNFVNMAYTMLVAIGLNMVIFFALPLAVVGTFVSLAATVHERGQIALIDLLMLRGIVGTNAIMLREIEQHTIEASADVRTAMIQGGRTRLHSILMTATATILARSRSR
jgi:hypothetical protein